MASDLQKLPHRNARQVCRFLWRQGTVSKHQLLEASGLTNSTLTRALEDLQQSGWIMDVGYGESTGGRRPILYRFDASCAYLFGVEISRLETRLILTDVELNKKDVAIWAMDQEMTPDKLLALLAAEAKAMLHRHHISLRDVLGMGIGAVGPLERASGTILEPESFKAQGWKHVRIVDILSELLELPVFLDNGANTALLGESLSTEGLQASHHMLYVHAGIGLRSAMLSNGNVVYGAVDMEGAVGQMIIQTDGPAPSQNKGNYGSWESFATIPALEREAQSRLKQGRLSLLNDMVDHPDQVSFHHLLEALAGQDALTVELFTQSAVYFGIGLANLFNILHPEKVIIGGPIVASSDLYFETSKRISLKNTYYSPVYEVEFSKGVLGEEAVAIGAAALVVAKWLKEQD